MPTESGLNLTGFRITRTLDRLGYDLLLILRDTLSDPAVDLLRNQDDVEILEFRILALLSQPPYVKHLLWRDYRVPAAERWHRIRTSRKDEVRIHAEAIDYFYKVLRRRLGLAQNLRAQPSNMHLLLQAGCRFGPAEQGWPHATIKRARGLEPRQPTAGALQRTVEALERQYRELAREPAQPQDTDADQTIVARRRAEFGPLWLIVADWVAEIVAELSLFHDVLHTLPTPLPVQFVEDAEWQKRLQRVLESLNERYGLLRSCGLDPQVWFDSEALSVNVLKGIKKLHSSVDQRRKEKPDEKRPIAYEICFNALKGQKARFAGCETFSEFVETEVGNLLVWGGHAPLPPDEPTRSGGESEGGDESGVTRHFDPDDLGAEPTREEADPIIDRCPELARDALMKAVVRVAFAGRALDEPEIMAELRGLIDQNDLHKKKFGKFKDDRALVKALCNHAQQIVQRHQQRLNSKSLS